MNCCHVLIVIVKVLVISTSTYVVAEVVQHSRVDGFRNNQSGILMIGDKVAGSRGKDHADVMDGTYIQITMCWRRYVMSY